MASAFSGWRGQEFVRYSEITFMFRCTDRPIRGLRGWTQIIAIDLKNGFYSSAFDVQDIYVYSLRLVPGLISCQTVRSSHVCRLKAEALITPVVDLLHLIVQIQSSAFWRAAMYAPWE